MAFSRKSAGGWGPLGSIFRFAQVNFRYRLYELVTRLLPEEVIHAFGYVLGDVLQGAGGNAKKRVFEALRMLHHDRFTTRQYEKIAQHTIRFIGLLVMDTIFMLPRFTQDLTRLRRRLEFQNLHYYQEAAAYGTGIIITSIHLSQFFRALVALPLIDPTKKMYAIANMKNMELYSLPFHQAGLKLIPAENFPKIRPTLKRILRENNALSIAWDMGGRATQLKVKFLEYLVPSPGSVVSLAMDTGAPILPAVVLPKRGCGYTRHVVKFLPPIIIKDKGSKKETFGQYNTQLNALFAPYFRQYPFLWEEILGFDTWRTERVFRFPNGANLAQVTSLAATYLQQLVDTSWEEGREDEKIRNICRSMQTIANVTDPRFQSYPFQFQRKIRNISINLDRTSVVRIFEQLLDFLKEYPMECGEMVERDRKFFKPRGLPEEETAAITNELERLRETLT
ncbi:MAG TPA: hypothetical protein VKK79_15035 [Candidatus Lokiarchaeia archaeon]|nr:hypothetical protein [Candidatus Lokiarchaeia archaeon]